MLQRCPSSLSCRCTATCAGNNSGPHDTAQLRSRKLAVTISYYSLLFFVSVHPFSFLLPPFSFCILYYFFTLEPGWNPIRQRGGTFDLFANMKGGPKAAPPRQLSRKALHAVQGSSPTGGGGDGASPSEDEQGISDSGEAAERPRPPMLKRSDRSGPPPLLRSGGATLSLAAIAVAEAKTVGDSLIEVSMYETVSHRLSSFLEETCGVPWLL